MLQIICWDARLWCYCIAKTYLISFLMLQLGGLNSILAVEHSPSIPIVSKAPTIILGMDVSHGSPGQSDIPSIAAVILVLHFSVLSLYLKLLLNYFIYFLSTSSLILKKFLSKDSFC